MDSEVELEGLVPLGGVARSHIKKPKRTVLDTIMSNSNVARNIK